MMGPSASSPRLAHSKCEHHWLMRDVSPIGRFLGLRHTACPKTRQWIYRECGPCVFGDYGDRDLPGSECNEHADCNELKVCSQEHPGQRLNPVPVQCSPACPALAGPFPGGQDSRSPAWGQYRSTSHTPSFFAPQNKDNDSYKAVRMK